MEWVIVFQRGKLVKLVKCLQPVYGVTLVKKGDCAMELP